MQIEVFFSRIRALTSQACSFVNDNDMEKCLPLIAERQGLLENLHKLLNINGNLDDGSIIKQSYIELLVETKENDRLALEHVIIERDNIKNSIQQQSITNKAISAYQKTLLG